MEVVAGFVAEAALSAAFDALFGKLSSEDVLKYARRKNVKSEVDQWSKLLHKLKCVLDDAEERQMSEGPMSEGPIKLWLDDLRDLSYDVEDILDEFSYEVLRQKVTAAETEASMSKVRKLIHISCSCFSPREIKFNMSLGSKMKEITQRFEAITKEKENLRLTERAIGGTNGVPRERLEPTGSIEESPVYGREKDKETLVDKLLSSDSNGKRISVVAIVGMGGLGKTRMAQLVHNNETVSRSFDIKAWVCVSDDFDVLNISVKIIESFTSKTCDMKDLDNVQKKLKDVAHGKKFLLVLDDMWNENSLKWDVLIQPLAAGELGSKVLITTRNKNVAATASAGFMHSLKKLELKECLSLLAFHAFGVDTFNGRPLLQEVGEQIAKKCDGLPLAAKAIGGLLRGKLYPDEWRMVLNSDTWSLNCPILPALRVSYHYLPAHLKRCFAYCAIFPKDYEFNKDKLILWWMAEGLLDQSKLVLSNFEEVGNEYFKDLLSRSFFQPSTDDENSKFVMHDLMNDLAVWVSGGKCLHLPTYEETNYAIKFEKPRHLSFMSRDSYEFGKRFEKFPISIGLRTFIGFTPRILRLSSVVLERVIPKMRYLKLLCLSGYWINKLPDSISELKHLRHLDLSNTNIKSLPESVCDLLNLEVLNLNGCFYLVLLPREIRKLINLRVLGIRKTYELKAMPSEIGGLKNLQILSKFIVGENRELRLNELKDLSLLRGKLSISGLEKMGHVQEARAANLKAKECLISLKFKWEWLEETSIMEKEKQVGILDELRPHTVLRSLKIDGYNGNGFPKWVGDCRFTNLEKLFLRDCYSASSLPPLGGLMSLKELHVIGLHEVKRVGEEFLGNTLDSDKTFLSLQTLDLGDMNGLEEWFSCFGSGAEVVFPQLQKMKIWNCPVLVGKLPNHLPSLEELRISGCPNLRNFQCSYPSLKTLVVEDCSEATLKTLGDLTSLRSLTLVDIDEMIFMEDDLISMLGSLQELNIYSCRELRSLVKNNKEIEVMVGLKRLTIESCYELVSFGPMRLPSSLKKMHISRCNALKWLPEGFMMDGSSTCESALMELTIAECPALTTFPRGRFPDLLVHLYIDRCYNLKSIPRGRFPDLLVDLTISRCENLQNMPEFSSSIKKLRINGCHHLQSLPEFSNSMKDISIADCPRLQNLPRFPAPLVSLEIGNLTSLACERTDIGKSRLISSNNESFQYLECSDFGNVEEVGSEFEKMFVDCSFSLESLYVWRCNLRTLPENISAFKRLKKLLIYCCENLRRLPKQIQELSCLRTLSIGQCPNLELLAAQDLPRELESLDIDDSGKVMECLFAGGLSRLVSLKYLDINGGSRVGHTKPQSPPVFLPKLQYLTMANFENLESLAAAFHLHSSVVQLCISRCPKLKELPIHELSSNLGELRISECPLLKKRCLDRKGEYWPLLSIIPLVRIDEEDLSI